jgi:hypothetical protein
MPDHSPDRLTRRFPILSAVRDHPGLILGTGAALTSFFVGAVLPNILSSLSPRVVFAGAGPLGGLFLGVGLGYDIALSGAAVRRLFAVGSVLLIFGFLGLAIGGHLALLVAGPLAFALKSVALGHRLSGAQPG